MTEMSKTPIEKHEWEKAWEENKFSIKTLTPSILVSKYEGLLKKGDKVLDVGCGNGRNTLYLASKGYEVDCFDVADVGWQERVPESILKNIDFKKTNVVDYPYKVSNYRVIIVARVIQYLTQEELTFLINKVRSSLTPDGFLLLSFTAQGGIFNQKSIDVSTHSYSREQIESLLKNVFGNVVICEGCKRNRHVNYEGDVVTFDIFASDMHPQ